MRIAVSGSGGIASVRRSVTVGWTPPYALPATGTVVDIAGNTILCMPSHATNGFYAMRPTS